MGGKYDTSRPSHLQVFSVIESMKLQMCKTKLEIKLRQKTITNMIHSNWTPLATFLFLLPGLIALIPACFGGALG